MPLQDLTPQLRTRLTRVERGVGWFVAVAVLLLLVSFVSYLYHTANHKGWFKIKAVYVTYVSTADGISVGDPVSMMGFPIGQVLLVDPPPPRVAQGVRVEFEVQEPHYKYIWSEGSFVRVNSSGFLGKRGLEVTRGTNGFQLCSTHEFIDVPPEEAALRAIKSPGRWQLFQNVYDSASNLALRCYAQLAETNAAGELNTNNLPRLFALHLDTVRIYDNRAKDHRIASVWNRPHERYEANTGQPVFLSIEEAPALTERIGQMVAQVQAALPSFLALTNRINKVLDNTAAATANLNTALVGAQPMVTNLVDITGTLRGPGGLERWALNTNGADQISLALTNVNTALTNVNTLLGHTDTNLDALTQDVALTLIHLANITSNLDTQVQNNPQAISNVMKTIVDTDDLIQGLKRHWLLRSAFKTKPTNAPPAESTTTPAGPRRGR